MSNLTRHFWDWNEPVLHQAVAELMRGWDGGELNLSDKVLIVPTAETGRRLREALAIEVSKKNGAVTAPYVLHPETALSWGADESSKATPLLEKSAWIKVLQAIDATKFTTLFPALPERLEAFWARSTADTIVSLKHTLGAGGYDIQMVAKKLEGEMDHARWCELATLEQQYFSILLQLQKEDEQVLKRHRSMNPQLPSEVSQIWMLATIDPPLLLRQWLMKVAKQIPVKIFVHAPMDKDAAYDALGVPRLEWWNQQYTQASNLKNEDIIVVQSLQDQALRTVECLKKMVHDGMSLAVGVCDPALNSVLESALAMEDCHAFDPAGRTAETHVFLEVLRVWQRVVQSGAWQDLASFLRLEDVARAVCEQGMSQRRLFELLDDLHVEHLPSTLEDAIALSQSDEDQSLHTILKAMQSQVDQWSHGCCREALQALCQWIYGVREFETEQEQDRDYVKLAGAALQLADELDEIQTSLKLQTTAVDMLGLLLDVLDSTRLAEFRGEVDFVLHGWLELPWEPATGLVITGFNEEHVPGIVTGDPFLPDKLRQQLGLASQMSRLARDRALLTAIIAQRQQQGSLKLMLGKVNKQGDAMRPSRLLFDGADEALVERVRHLFPKEESVASAAEPPKHIGLKLRPPLLDNALTHISPSAINQYLTCPFRYYLGRVLKMDRVDAQMREASVMDFGNLIHETLYDYAMDATMGDCVDTRMIAEYLDSSIVKKWRTQYGYQPLLSLEMQLESARQRLAAAADSLATIRAEGWRTLYAEQAINDWGLTLGGLAFRGKLDRVDQHVTTNALRLWDYKTGNPKSPKEAHLTSTKEAGRSWLVCQDGGDKPRRWIDVQLPLYVWALQQKHPDLEVTAAYFLLPATVTNTGEKRWDELDNALVIDAVRCGEETVQHLKDGEFWPPTIDIKHDDFEFLLDDPLLTVDPGLLLAGGTHD